VIRPARPCEYVVEAAERGQRRITPIAPLMTVPHRTEALAAPSLTAAVVALRTRGMRVSGPRRALLEALYDAPEPRTAEQLAGDLDMASVYRNLDALEHVGLIRHVHAGHGAGRYALAVPRDHGYAACEACGRHEPLPAEALETVRAAVRSATGFENDFIHFPIIGLCPECLPHPRKEQHAHP
jgi:Fur family ferric uptake transcriptional regulator